MSFIEVKYIFCYGGHLGPDNIVFQMFPSLQNEEYRTFINGIFDMT